jgi:phosphoadenosine phosphosulfate reductase
MTDLIRTTFAGPVDIVKEAIERIRENSPAKPYVMKNSFGKDSGVVHKLMELSEVPFDSIHNLTTVDPPELIRHGMKNYPETEISRPDFTVKMKDGRTPRIRNIYQLIIYKGFPPLRNRRYCCDYLKERGIRDCLQVLGKRKEESPARSGITLLEECHTDKRQHFFNPIFDWSTKEVWEFTIKYKVPYCCLYDQGFDRMGCVMCPQACEKQREFEASFFPKHYVTYLRCFDAMLKFRPDMAEKYNWHNAVEVMDWWLRRSSNQNDHTVQSILLEGV